MGGGEGRVADAEVIGQAGEEEAGEASLAEVVGEAGRGLLVVFEKGGVAVDVAAEALAKDQFGVRKVEAGVDLGTGSALDAVVGPEVLGAVRSLDGVGEREKAVGAGEGDMAAGVPVLGEEYVVEARGEGVDPGDDGVAAWDRERAAGEEVELHVDDEEGVCWAEGHGHFDVTGFPGPCTWANVA